MRFFSFRWLFASRFRTLVSIGSGIAVLFLWLVWADVCLWKAETDLALRHHESAAKWIDRSLWFGRGLDAHTCLLQIRVARRRGNFKDVECKLKQAKKLSLSRAELERERWIAMAQANQFDAMKSHWSELMSDARDDEPEIARAYYTWAVLNHQFDVAQKTLDVWHKDFPQDAEPLFLSGRYSQSLYDWENAEKSYRAAYAAAPANDEICLALANTLRARLNAREASGLYQSYLQRHPDDIAAIEGLAQSFASNGENEKAIQLLQKSLERHSDSFELLKAYGEMLLAGGDAAAAAVSLEKAYRMIPEHANLANSLARSWKASGRAAEAEPLFAFVAESRPKLDEMKDLEKELRHQPNNLELRMKIAAITAKYVSRREGARWYENLLAIAPNYLPAHRELAELYRSLGDDRRTEFHARFLAQHSQ